ncbi:hypothetical protein COLO4_28570 [Corchorus olitorius]|uniref:Uncharacterized protein n=1 Tax=Corchorus olitorius TaxID=93759 RepID=A0A1R3HJP1_9ROSI|nr:hypothetical protein COLO4_28570 [Corchorus olitorius]
MHFQQTLKVGFWQKLMVIVLLLLFLLLVSGDQNEESMFAAMNVHSQGDKENQTVNQKQQQPQQRLRHSFDAFFSSKRRVPNASDPLHNR